MAGTLGTLNIIRGPAPPAPGAWQGSGRRRQRAVFKPVIQQDDENAPVKKNLFGKAIDTGKKKGLQGREIRR